MIKDKNLSKMDLFEKTLKILRFQFRTPIFSSIIRDRDELDYSFSKNTGRLRKVIYQNDVILIYKPDVGRFNLTLKGAIYLKKATEPPVYRIIVLTEIQDYIKDGKSVFSQHVLEIDQELRPKDEVIVVNEEDDLLGVGKMMLPPFKPSKQRMGVVVDVRKGINKLATDNR
ncbi:MAG: pseudouridine synthase [Candidatus Lokiarchaeota archaeon]|nr:pseudouridine synthase [Candidatus Lokiarchaeota archaeon]